MATTSAMIALGQAITQAQAARRRYEDGRHTHSEHQVKEHADAMAESIQSVAKAIAAVI